MKLSKFFKVTLITSALVLSSQVFAKDGKIKIGVMAGPELSVAQVAKQVAKDKYNLEVELVQFTDYVTPNAALANKLIDANAFQHKPFLEGQIKDRGWNNFVIVGNTFVFPIAAYSKKIKNLNELKDGATIVIPNDPTNAGRSLLLLQAQGLITLKHPQNLIQTVLDIDKNPKNLKIQTLDANLIARALGQVDIAIINNTFAGQANLYPNRDAIFVENKESPYVNLIVARKDNEEDVDVKNFVKAYNTDAVYEKAMSEFQDSIVKGWE